MFSRSRVGEFFCFVVLLIGLAEAQTRTWGFSREAVSEWAANGDTVALTNQANDTLKFDTAWLELVSPASHGLLVGFSIGLSNPSLFALNTPSASQRGVSPKFIKVPPSQSMILREFFVDADAPPLAKYAALGDTLRARMILRAVDGSRDTLLVSGVQQTVSIRFSSRLKDRSPVQKGDLFDIRGRRLQVNPTTRIPSTIGVTKE